MILHPVYKKALAMKLRDLGYPIMDAYPNDRNPKYIVYLFEETPEFLLDFNKYFRSIEKVETPRN